RRHELNHGENKNGNELNSRLTLTAVGSAACSRLLAFGEQAHPRRANILPVLTYHRVDHENAHPELYPGLISATPGVFNEQMSFLAANYRVVSMLEVLDAAGTGAALPPRSVLVTFDDAYRDFAEHARPILQRYRLPATLFVPTA